MIIDLGTRRGSGWPDPRARQSAPTLDIYAHTFDDARHTADTRVRMARSAFAGLLDNDEHEGTVITLPAVAHATSGPLSARQRAAIKCRNLTKT